MDLYFANLHRASFVDPSTGRDDLHPLQRGWIEGLREQPGVGSITVVQRHHRNGRVEQGPCSVLLVADRGGVAPGPLRPCLRIAGCVGALLRERPTRDQPAIVHLDGLLYPAAAIALRRAASGLAATVVQHHAERPWIGLRRRLQRLGYGGCDGFLFSSHHLARPWIDAGVIADPGRVHEVMETSSLVRFAGTPPALPAEAITGDPALLWAGRLNANKDPLTVLEAFAAFLGDRPAARLYMAFLGDDLLSTVRRFLAAQPAAAQAVTLLGPRSLAQMAGLLEQADILVQGSHREGSGIAVLDALAFGVTPVVTDIPSLRALTADGEHGHLWRVGDSDACRRALLDATVRLSPERRRRIAAYAGAELSFSALGKRATACYRQAWAQRRDTGR